MSTKATDVQPRVLTVAEAAADLHVSPDKVMAWINKGYVKTFIDPDAQNVESRPGPRTVRIWRSDWDRFAETYSTRGPQAAIAEAQAVKVKRKPIAAAVGTDGVSRRKRAARRGDDS